MATGRIRRVDVEFLRRGDRTGQLLSKHVDYLAVCEGGESRVVHAPMDHPELLRLLDDLRYEVGRDNEHELESIRAHVGAQLASFLGGVPGLEGLLAPRPDELVHLRLTISASELALLPFELTHMPSAFGSSSDRLLTQPDRQVELTRHVRAIRGPAAGWADRPRVLFIAGPDVPFEDHLDALLRALRPWHGRFDAEVRWCDGDSSDPAFMRSPWMTALREPTIETIAEAAAKDAYSHVHVLGHGVAIAHRNLIERFDLQLSDGTVDGERLASALGAGGRLPDVVTLAVCDSAGQESPLANGGSLAFELHSQGVPLVVGSQFPITEAASVPFVERLYEGLFRGDHPLESVAALRRRLRTSFDAEHAWASIVTYESLPQDLDGHLETLRYWQARRARGQALDDLQIAIANQPELRAECEQRAEQALIALPSEGMYGSESLGLRAAGYKRLAELTRVDEFDSDLESSTDQVARSLAWLDRAAQTYEAAAQQLLGPRQPDLQLKANIYWLVGQVVSMAAVVGKPMDLDALATARYSARQDRRSADPDTRAWACAALLELELLELGDGVDDEAIAVTTTKLLALANQIVEESTTNLEQQRQTGLQMARYATWWTSPAFAALVTGQGRSRPARWDTDGVVATAAHRLAEVLGWVEAASVAPPSVDRDGSVNIRLVDNDRSDVGRHENRQKQGFFRIELLPARNGDCIWISYGDKDTEPHHVMIDCGASAAAEIARARIMSVDEVELFVLTHIDADHISGAIPLFEHDEVRERIRHVWFNGRHQLRGFLSVSQGEAYTALLDQPDRHYLWNGIEAGSIAPPIMTSDPPPEIWLPGGMCLTVLSPTHPGLAKLARHWNSALKPEERISGFLGRRARPTPVARPEEFDVAASATSGATRDTSVPNLSSIAFLAEYGGRSILLTGDAHADVLAASIRNLQRSRGREGSRLRLDAFKLSHHGSATATTRELLDLIRCDRYVVPSDGTSFYHPDREAISRVLVAARADESAPQPELVFNYRTEFNELWSNADLQSQWSFTATYPEADREGSVVEL